MIYFKVLMLVYLLVLSQVNYAQPTEFYTCPSSLFFKVDSGIVISANLCPLFIADSNKVFPDSIVKNSKHIQAIPIMENMIMNSGDPLFGTIKLQLIKNLDTTTLYISNFPLKGKANLFIGLIPFSPNATYLIEYKDSSYYTKKSIRFRVYSIEVLEISPKDWGQNIMSD